MNPGIKIISIGNGDPDLLNGKTIRILHESCHLFLRTEKHPIVSWLRENGISFSSFDYLYDESEDFDMLNLHIAELLIRSAEETEIIYAVPDPLTDRSVRLLFQNKPMQLSVSLVPGISSYDIHLSSSLDHLRDSSLLIVTACDLTDHFQYDPSRSLLITELDNQFLAGQVKIVLSEMLQDDYAVYLLSEDHVPEKIPLFMVDRHQHIDHRTALLVPGSGIHARSRFVFSDLSDIMDMLRSANGCPWDRMQTHESLRPYLIEEAWECIACIDQQDSVHLSEELGDLLYQIIFHSSIAKSFDEFSLTDVVSTICLKMIRRHPHVFGNLKLNDSDSVKAEWEEIKKRETGHLSLSSCLDDVSEGLPALLYAGKIIKKINPSLPVQSDLSPVLHNIQDLVIEMSASPGDLPAGKLACLLLLCSVLCCFKETNGELVLHKAADSLKRIVSRMETDALKDGKSLEHLTFEELGVYLHYVEDEIE